MKSISVVVSLGVVLAAGAARAQEPSKSEVLGLREVLERVRANNASLRAANAGVDVAQGEVRSAWTGWQPTINAIGTVTLNSQESLFAPGAFFPPSFIDALNMLRPGAGDDLRNAPPQTLQGHVQYSAVLAVSQTLFNIGVLRAPEVAKAARAAADVRADAVEDELLFSAATIYATLAGLKALETAAERAIAVAEQRLKDARLQLEVGTATPLAITRADTDRVVAEGQKISVRARQRALLANLRALIGADGEIDVRAERLEERVKDMRSDYSERTVIKARELELEAAEKAIGLSDMAWLPYLTADGQVRWASISGFAGDNLSATLSINLVLPIYDAGRRYADTDIAEARAAQAQHLLEQERRQARAFLDEARATLESSRSELEQAEAQLKLAAEAVKQAEDLVRHGLATNLELNDADSKRFSADRTVAQKLLELDLAALRAYYASGGRLLE